MDAVLMILFLFACEVAAQRSWIGWMRARHVSQVQKAYGTRIDEEVKAKVPSMGGVVFLLIGSGLLMSSVLRGDSEGAAFWSYPILSAAVGLADDLLKFRGRSSEGLRSMQKFALQVATTLLWFVLLALETFQLCGTAFRSGTGCGRWRCFSPSACRIP